MSSPVDQEAHVRNTNELKGIFSRLSDKGDAVNKKMAAPFKTLAELGDFQAPLVPQSSEGDEEVAELTEDTPTPSLSLQSTRAVGAAFVVHHDVHIHLPTSTDIAVYDAIFRSLRENLR